MKNLLLTSPLLQTDLWMVLALFAGILFYRQLKTLINTLLTCVQSGSSFKAGPFEIGEDLKALKHVKNQEDSPMSKEDETLLRLLDSTSLPSGNYGSSKEFQALHSFISLSEKSIPDDSLKTKPVPLLESPSAHFIKSREDAIKQNRGLFLAHVLEPSKNPGQKYDIFIFLVRHQSTDFSDIAYAEFFLGPYWGNQIFYEREKRGLIGIATSAYGPFLCICRVTFKDKTQINLHRYIDFEMGKIFHSTI